ncbi:MAG TPA: hypothetical protein VGR21_03325 [Cryptosporangiaceae bacterium]|nr:hypothetical protein [Cryptosporangiaceae bacterium]
MTTDPPVGPRTARSGDRSANLSDGLSGGARAPRLVTLHVWRVPTRRVPAAVARMGWDRLGLARVPGLQFAKLLGTGRGATFTPGADTRRWGLVASWHDAGAVAAFEASSLVRGWGRLAEESWRAELVPLGARGRWARRAPFGRPEPRDWDGPIAVLTRARLTLRQIRRFWRAVPPVTADVNGRDGLLAAFGFGEAPWVWQGTFSMWRDAAAVRAFAYQGAAHRAAIQATEETGWYAEELFARFGVSRASGTLDDEDPFARLPAGPSSNPTTGPGS